VNRSPSRATTRSSTSFIIARSSSLAVKNPLSYAWGAARPVVAYSLAVSSDRGVRVDHPGAELDRRHVPLADRPQAHDEAEAPGASPDWSGATTIEGLPSAAASIEYSCVK
jgi:hypothetical protein